VHLPDKQVKFQWDPNGLYIYKPPDKSEPGINIEAQFINTLEENKKFYTQRQFEQAKRAQELFHSLGTPSINDMKAIIRMNTIKNNPVTTEDVNIAKKIFGLDISSFKGNTSHRRPVPVIGPRGLSFEILSVRAPRRALYHFATMVGLGLFLCPRWFFFRSLMPRARFPHLTTE
jgi:hypothetical protein